jgi:uncharacterized protein
MTDAVRHNAAESRFELAVDGHVAAAFYRAAEGVLTFVHTEVPPEIGGRGVGTRLVRGALEQTRAMGFKAVPRCSFVAAVIARHPEFNDLLL